MIQERRDNPIDKDDLLNIMLHGVDKKTGKKLSDENIRHNVSWVVAGIFFALTLKSVAISSSLSSWPVTKQRLV